MRTTAEIARLLSNNRLIILKRIKYIHLAIINYVASSGGGGCLAREDHEKVEGRDVESAAWSNKSVLLETDGHAIDIDTWLNARPKTDDDEQ